MENVSLIYVNYFTSNLIKNSIASFVKYVDNINYEIIIVDNSCDNDELNKLKNISNNIIVVTKNENLGFGKANNFGVSNAKYGKIFFVNPDTIFIENSVKILADLLNDEKIGIIGCNLLTNEKKPNHSFSKNISVSQFKKDNSIFKIIKRKIKGKFCNSFNFSNKLLDVGYVCGAALMTKKEIFLSVGGFDEDIFMYCEDDELCFLTRKSGFRVVNTPLTSIIHLDGGSFKEEYSKSRFIRKIDGCICYFKKCYSLDELKRYLRLMIKKTKFKKFISKNSEKGIYKFEIEYLKKKMGEIV